MNTGLISERRECVRELVRGEWEEKTSEAVFWTDPSQFPGVSKPLEQPGGNSSLFFFFSQKKAFLLRRGQEALVNPRAGGSVLPAGWISGKRVAGPKPLLGNLTSAT